MKRQANDKVGIRFLDDVSVIEDHVTSNVCEVRKTSFSIGMNLISVDYIDV